ncbi:DNA polymerase I A, chloroplastic/mitochondrial-like [Euphorbia lathyris]|uniref:DNA polymerase I A, chloroplastic/mitochondrial-like n=1 Tax=Euphorbia lathyris TaxID=212925 RepID=UPI0033136F99
MGLSTTQISPFKPMFPSYFKFSCTCPCFASLPSSSRPFSNVHRFRAQMPSGVLMNLQRSGEKMLPSGSYSTLCSMEVATELNHSTKSSWQQNRERLRVRRLHETEIVQDNKIGCVRGKNEHVEGSSGYSFTNRTMEANKNNILAHKSSSTKQAFRINDGGFVDYRDHAASGQLDTELKTEIGENMTSIDVHGKGTRYRMPEVLPLENASRGNAQANGSTVLKGNGHAVKKRPNGFPLSNSKQGAHNAESRSMNIFERPKEKQFSEIEHADLLNETNGRLAVVSSPEKPLKVEDESSQDIKKRLTSIYGKVLVVNNLSMAREVVQKLTNQYRHLVHACDTEVAKIDVKQETPIDHGEIICFSIYCGPEADFGNGKSCIWVDILDGGAEELLKEFDPFFKDCSIKKVWHNYSFDKHVIENYGISVNGFHADTMHMARLWNSSRRTDGGYSLEGLTGDRRVMNGVKSCYEELIGKVSMKTIFGKKKLKKDGSEGKIIIIDPVEDLQRNEREPWICYSALDAISTWQLYESLKNKLCRMPWKHDGKPIGKSMFDFYKKYWQPFGELLVRMETEGILVDRAYLAEVEKIAKAEQQLAANRFRNWACKYCPDAKYMNVGSDTQLRQLFFGGIANSKDPTESLPIEKAIKVPNVDKVIEEGKKAPTKFRTINLHNIGKFPAEIYTATGWPSVSGDALKILAGKVSAEYDFMDENVMDGSELETVEDLETEVSSVLKHADTSAYGTALQAFSSVEEGIEACHAIASLCEVCTVDSLISNFILPLQGSNISGKRGRVHCSLNINTETGRLSARRPNLQNQPALEKDRYKIRQAFIAAPGNSLIVADYGQLELRILAHLANCKSMLEAFEAGGDFHSRTAMNMYPHIREAVDKGEVILEWYPQPGQDKPPVPLLKDAFGSERRKAKMLNFSIAYGKTPVGLSRDWKVSVEEAKETVELWYRERQEVRKWQEARKKEARQHGCVHTLLGRARIFPSIAGASNGQRGHIERAAINTPVQGSAADVAMCAMLQITTNMRLSELGWKLLLQIHDEVILEGPSESTEEAKAIVVDCMAKPFDGQNFLKVELSVDAKCAQNWYSAK